MNRPTLSSNFTLTSVTVPEASRYQVVASVEARGTCSRNNSVFPHPNFFRAQGLVFSPYDSVVAGNVENFALCNLVTVNNWLSGAVCTWKKAP